jgi:hypothetical protein
MATAETRRLRGRPPLRRPTEAEIDQARRALRLIDAGQARVTVRDDHGTEPPEEIPPLALTILTPMLDELARGNAVTLDWVPRLLTIPQAAELLGGVSWAYVKDLIARGELPSPMVEEKEVVVFEDVMALRERKFEAPGKALDEMVALSQELGLYGGRPPIRPSWTPACLTRRRSATCWSNSLPVRSTSRTSRNVSLRDTKSKPSIPTNFSRSSWPATNRASAPR